MSGVLNAIGTLDGAGYLHRDIKGDNILVGRNREGVLADFGLCVLASEAATAPELVGDGTPEYSAPEVSRGTAGSSLNSDLFSFFVVFAESILVRHPFCGKVITHISALLHHHGEGGTGGAEMCRSSHMHLHGTIP